MNPLYGTTTTEKILAWRDLRRLCVEKSAEEQIESVNIWWTYLPWVKSTIDQYTPSSWPSPWELLEKGEVCRSSIALGQAYTLWMCAPALDVELQLINNFDEKEVHLITVINSDAVLNYTQGYVAKIADCDYELLETIKKTDLNHIKLL